MSEDIDLIVRIDERLKALSERYHQDRDETRRRYEAERDERRLWREGIEEKIESFEQKIGPVIRDHELIVRSGKWVLALISAGFGAFKFWDWVRGHFR